MIIKKRALLSLSVTLLMITNFLFGMYKKQEKTRKVLQPQLKEYEIQRKNYQQVQRRIKELEKKIRGYNIKMGKLEQTKIHLTEKLEHINLEEYRCSLEELLEITGMKVRNKKAWRRRLHKELKETKGPGRLGVIKKILLWDRFIKNNKRDKIRIIIQLKDPEEIKRPIKEQVLLVGECVQILGAKKSRLQKKLLSFLGC